MKLSKPLSGFLLFLLTALPWPLRPLGYEVPQVKAAVTVGANDSFVLLPHDKNNCWLNVSVWAIFMGMPELVAALLGDHGDYYLAASSEGAKGFKAEKIKIARLFTKVIRELHKGKVQLEDAKELQKTLLGGDVSTRGMASPYYAVGLILGALTLDYALWSATELTGPQGRPFMFNGASVNVSSPDEFANLNVFKSDSENPCTFVAVGPYLVIKLSYKMDTNDKTKLAHEFFTKPFSVKSTISIKQCVTEKLTQEMKDKKVSFEYELIASLIHQGWAHVVAYLAKEDGGCYLFDDIAHPQVTSIKENVAGPWKGGCHPQVLIYRRKGGGGVAGVALKTTIAGAEQIVPLASALQALVGKK